MKQTFLLSSILAFSASFFISTAAWGANSDIIINEIGASPTSTHEWIEIWNKGTEPVDLTGWKFWENTTNHGLTATTTDSILAPGEYGAICQNSTAFLLDHSAFGGSIFNSSWSSLSENGEEIGLKDEIGNFIEQFTYQPASTHSLERKNPTLPDYSANNWQEHLTGDTLGFQNSNYSITTETTTTTTPTIPTDIATTTSNTLLMSSVSTSSLWKQIKINEFLPNPEDGDEWIELYNPTTSSLDLADGLLCDNRDTSCTIATTSGTIAAQSWTTFFLNGSHLNNNDDSIILKNPDEIIIDQVNYGTDALPAPEKGQAVARKNDGADSDADTDWAITTSLTPGSSNVVVEPVIPTPVNNSGGGSSGGGGGSASPTASLAPVPTNQKTATSTNKTTTKSATSDQTKIVWKISAPRAAAPQEIAELSAAGSVDPRGGAIFMSWNLGDGTIVDGQTITHTFSASGTYHITIYATSTQGTTGQQFFSVLVAPGLSTHHGEVLISEVFPNPPGVDQGEFVELFNSASTGVALAGWKLETNSGKGFTIPEKTVVKPGGCLVFYRAATHLILDNSKEVITLKTPDDVVADQVSYSKSEPNQSLSLINGARGWTQEITPGFIGVTAGQVLGEKITINKSPPTPPVKLPRPQSTPSHLTLALARTLNKGSTITIQGVVTVPPGTFSEHYFYVTDDSGGMQIYSSKKDLPPLALGDKISVVGRLSQANGLPRVNIASARAIDILATKQILEQENMALGDIDESTAGKLVTVTGEITDVKGNQLYLDDGETEGVVYLKTATHIDRSRLKAGTNLQIAGIVEQTKNGWQIWPRSNEDIKPTASSAPIQSSNKNNYQTFKYMVVTGGGASLLALAFFLQRKTRL